MFVQTLEERRRCSDVSDRVRVEDDHIVKVGRHLFQALYNLTDNLDGPPGRRAATLGHDEPLI